MTLCEQTKAAIMLY